MGLIMKNGIQYPGVGSGEGSGLEISQLDDVKITPPLENGDKLVYDKEKGKWTNTTKYHNYSTEEQVVGTWIDGKPIYEKVFEIGSKSSAYTFTIENLDKIIDYTGNCIISDYSRIIPFVQPQYNNYVIINDYKDGIVNLATNLTYTDCVLVIQYTKTTD